jgi:hypothetical protein
MKRLSIQEHASPEKEQGELGVQKASMKKKNGQKGPGNRRNFTWWNREDQLEAFFAWLPKELVDAPGIDWTTLPAGVMGYLIKTIGDSPDAAVMAVCAASVRSIDENSQYTLIKNLGALFKNLRATTSMQCLADLKQEQKEQTRQKLAAYISVVNGHFLHYLHLLTLPEQQRMRQYALPPPPADLSKNFFPHKQLSAAQQKERKATTDIRNWCCRER